jgi:hypothetical protein
MNESQGSNITLHLIFKIVSSRLGKISIDWHVLRNMCVNHSSILIEFCPSIPVTDNQMAFDHPISMIPGVKL